MLNRRPTEGGLFPTGMGSAHLPPLPRVLPSARTRIRCGVRCGLLMSFGLLFSGCGVDTDISDLRVFVEETHRDAQPEVEPLPLLNPDIFARLIYSASDQKDPFSPANLQQEEETAVTTLGDTAGPDRSRPKEPLEQFALGELTLVGMLEQGRQNWAIIRAPDQSIHRVQAGNFVGQFDGRIVTVNAHSMRISELKRNPVGEWETQETELFLIE